MRGGERDCEPDPGADRNPPEARDRWQASVLSLHLDPISDPHLPSVSIRQRHYSIHNNYIASDRARWPLKLYCIGGEKHFMRITLVFARYSVMLAILRAMQRRDITRQHPWQ